MSDLKLWTDDNDFIIAESPEEAARINCEVIGYESFEVYLDEHPLDEWAEYPVDKTFRLTHEDPDGVEEALPAHFIAKYGKGHLASVNY